MTASAIPGGVALLFAVSMPPGLALAAIGDPSQLEATGGECIGVPLPPRGAMNALDRTALEMRNRFDTSEAECRRLGGTFLRHPAQLTDADQPPTAPIFETMVRERREAAVRDYRQAMTDWPSGDSCDNLASKMQRVGEAMAVATGTVFVTTPVTNGSEQLLGYSVFSNEASIGTWVCTDQQQAQECTIDPANSLPPGTET